MKYQVKSFVKDGIVGSSRLRPVLRLVNLRLTALMKSRTAPAIEPPLVTTIFGIFLMPLQLIVY